MTTFDRLQQILIGEYDLQDKKLAPTALLDELGVDSLGLMELMFKIEEEFQIEAPNEKAALTTLADVVDYIDRLVAEQTALVTPIAAPIAAPIATPIAT